MTLRWLGWWKFLGRSGVDAKLVGVGTQQELEDMLIERRRLQFLAAQQRERLAQLKRQQSSEEAS